MLMIDYINGVLTGILTLVASLQCIPQYVEVPPTVEAKTNHFIPFYGSLVILIDCY